MNNQIFIKIAPNEYTKMIDEDIYWIESNGHFSIFNCEGGKKISAKISLSNLEKKLSKTTFLRIRRNIIINKIHVSNIQIATDELLINGVTLSIGKTFKVKVLEQFNLLG